MQSVDAFSCNIQKTFLKMWLVTPAKKSASFFCVWQVTPSLVGNTVRWTVVLNSIESYYVVPLKTVLAKQISLASRSNVTARRTLTQARRQYLIWLPVFTNTCGWGCESECSVAVRGIFPVLPWICSGNPGILRIDPWFLGNRNNTKSQILVTGAHNNNNITTSAPVSLSLTFGETDSGVPWMLHLSNRLDADSVIVHWSGKLEVF